MPEDTDKPDVTLNDMLAESVRRALVMSAELRDLAERLSRDYAATDEDVAAPVSTAESSSPAFSSADQQSPDK